MNNKWFVIINPTSGNCAAINNWDEIFNELKVQKFDFEHHFTQYKKHSIKLIESALKQGYINFICVGGDGTLHNMVNGILSLNPKNIDAIKIGVIPIGTGNDWVKTYKIPSNVKEAVTTIKKGFTIKQDIGKLTIENTNTTVYFNNLAGIGFDGYVVNKVHKYKNLGYLAYLSGAIVGILGYKKSKLNIKFNGTEINKKTLMLLIGLCKYSGGGMQLTENPDPIDGLFDISYIHKITIFNILGNIKSLFNGEITKHKLVKNYKYSQISVKNLSKHKAYIQADGEIVGTGNFTAQVIPKALNFIITNQKS